GGDEGGSEWRACFARLVDLQAPELSPDGGGVATLLAMDAFVRQFVLEFRFHFLSDRPTSSSDAVGSHCLPWVVSLVERWEGFLRRNLGPLLVSKFRGTEVQGVMPYVDPVSAFVTSLLPVLREKIESVAALAPQHPSLLSNLIAQLVDFDERIRNKFGYDGG